MTKHREKHNAGKYIIRWVTRYRGQYGLSSFVLQKTDRSGDKSQRREAMAERFACRKEGRTKYLQAMRQRPTTGYGNIARKLRNRSNNGGPTE